MLGSLPLARRRPFRMVCQRPRSWRRMAAASWPVNARLKSIYMQVQDDWLQNHAWNDTGYQFLCKMVRARHPIFKIYTMLWCFIQLCILSLFHFTVGAASWCLFYFPTPRCGNNVQFLFKSIFWLWWWVYKYL
jgi:hypothetical protein